MPKTGFKHSEESKKKMSVSKMGNKSHLGCTHSNETKKKISDAFKGRYVGEKNPFYGKQHSKETKLRWNFMKTGKTVSEETKKKMNKAHKGRKFSEKSKLKISQAMKGNKNSIGRICSDETKKKMHQIMTGDKHPQFGKRGDQSHNWKGGLTPEHIRVRNSSTTKQWRELVFKRDGWICQDCKKRGGKLQSHHIKSFAKVPELRFDINNGITLCDKCHDKRHNIKRKQGRLSDSRGERNGKVKKRSRSKNR